jgi:hypothetical protein
LHLISVKSQGGMGIASHAPLILDGARICLALPFFTN